MFGRAFDGVRSMVSVNVAEVALGRMCENPSEKLSMCTQLPSFLIPEADPPWMKCQKLIQWKNSFFVSTSASSINYGIFAKWAFQCAEINIKKNAMTSTKTKTMIPSHGEKYDVKMRAALMSIVPAKVLTKTLRNEDQNSVDILVDLITSVNPGARVESDSLKSFAARPGTATSASEAEEKLMHWQIARKRMKQIGLGELSTLDMVHALDMIVRDVVTTDVGFNHRYNCLVHRTVAVPSMEEAKRIEEFLEKELADFAVREPAMFGQQGP